MSSGGLAREVLRGGGGGDGEDTSTASTGGAAAVLGLPLGWLQELDELEETLSKVLTRQREYDSGEVARFDEEADDQALLRHVVSTIDKDGGELQMKIKENSLLKLQSRSEKKHGNFFTYTKQ
jgi:uncharacterized membrane protein